MHYCSKDSWNISQNQLFSSHRRLARTRSNGTEMFTESQEVKVEAVKSSSAWTEIFFLFVAAVYLLLFLTVLSQHVRLCWTWLINRVTLIFDPLVVCIVACFCHIKEPLIEDDHSLSAHTLPTPVTITHTETCGLILVLECITVSCFDRKSHC